MDELSKSLHFIIYNEVNRILDNISIDFDINREQLHKYAYEKVEDYVNNDNNIIEIPIISDGDSSEILDNPSIVSNLNNTNTNVKCKQLTRKGKQCDYNSKPNSEFCGRHSK